MCAKSLLLMLFVCLGLSFGSMAAAQTSPPASIQVSFDGITMIQKHFFYSDREEYWSITYDPRRNFLEGNVFYLPSFVSKFVDCLETGQNVDSKLFLCSVADPCTQTTCPGSGDWVSNLENQPFPRSWFERSGPTPTATPAPAPPAACPQRPLNGRCDIDFDLFCRTKGYKGVDRLGPGWDQIGCEGTSGEHIPLNRADLNVETACDCMCTGRVGNASHDDTTWWCSVSNGDWLPNAEWCARDTGVYDCPENLAGSVLGGCLECYGAGGENLPGTGRQAIYGRALLAYVCVSPEEAFEIFRLCHCPAGEGGSDGTGLASLDQNKSAVIAWLGQQAADIGLTTCPRP